MNSKEKISQISKNLALPDWWIESVIIEYLNCRSFAMGGELWSFDFDHIPSESLNVIPQLNIVISANMMLYHNISRDVLIEAFTKVMSGQPYKPVTNIQQVIVEGLASKKCFPIFWNPVDVWDPKLAFSDYCVVRDEDKFYQWKIGKFIEIKGSVRGWWVSDVVDLSDLRSINEKIQSLRDRFYQRKLTAESAQLQAINKFNH